MQKKRVSIHEIAKLLDIHSSTVSRALNDSQKVAPKTKQLVLSKAEELGYKRNLIASNLRKNKTNTIGVVVPRISRHFFSSTIAGIEEVAYKSGYQIIICQSLEELDREKKIINNLISNQVDGILISSSMETTEHAHIQLAKDYGIPIVFFDRHVEGFDSNKVLIDDYRAAFMATDHLAKRGCVSIAHFAGPQGLEIYKNRLKGYKEALEENRIPYKEDFVLLSRLMEKDGANLAKKLLKLEPAIDGLFSANDTAAMGAMKYFKQKNIRIPEDVAIVGFSNEPASEIIDPPLTTIDQSGMTMGKMALDLLLDQINGKVTAHKTIIMQSRLIERGSTGKFNM
ncbi:LacI family DNA-binding transcriptional regulator [Maribacter sp. 2304DJ31-5]|uniref:LacI family DNA-binding transcriptional regulator n=1 Tax=Maribacter sp. 2304DJ31-5 TaxID=3386273 RepID=UPI0039BC7789